MEEEKKEVNELEQFRNTVTAEEAQNLKERRDYVSQFVDDDRFKSLSILSDSTYDGFLERVGLCKLNLNFVMIYKKNLDSNKIDLLKGRTERKDRNGLQLELKDLEIENINADINVSNYMAKLRRSLRDLFKYVNLKKLDGSDIVSKEELFGFIDKIESEVKKINLTLYKEKGL